MNLISQYISKKLCIQVKIRPQIGTSIWFRNRIFFKQKDIHLGQLQLASFQLEKLESFLASALLYPSTSTESRLVLGLSYTAASQLQLSGYLHVTHPIKSTENDHHITSHQGVLHTFAATLPYFPAERSFYINIPPEYYLC